MAASACTGGSGTPNLSSLPPTGSASVTQSPSPSGSTSPVVPGVPADVPRTGHNVKPGEQPPVYPVAALAKTQAGANAFAVFFMQTLDWAYATTNPSYMKHYYGPTCGQCDGLATGIATTAQLNHWYEGGRLSTGSARMTDIAPVTAPASFCSLVSTAVTATTVVDHTGKIFNGAGASSGLEFKLCAIRDTQVWQTTYLARL